MEAGVPTESRWTLGGGECTPMTESPLGRGHILTVNLFTADVGEILVARETEVGREGTHSEDRSNLTLSREPRTPRRGTIDLTVRLFGHRQVYDLSLSGNEHYRVRPVLLSVYWNSLVLLVRQL